MGTDMTLNNRKYCLCFVVFLFISSNAQAQNQATLESLIAKARHESQQRVLNEFLDGIEKNKFSMNMDAVAYMYYNETDGLKKNQERGNEWLMQAALHNDFSAMGGIAERYKNGTSGFPQNTQLASLYYRSCASFGTFATSLCHAQIAQYYMDGEYNGRNENFDKNYTYYHLYMAIADDNKNENEKKFADFYKSLAPKELSIARYFTCEQFGLDRKQHKLCDAVLEKREKFALSAP
jgi:hypothetical protein